MLVIIIFGVAVITVSRVTLLQTVDRILRETVADIQRSMDPQPIAELEEMDEFEIIFRSDDFFHAPGFSVQVWRTFQNETLLDDPVLVRSSNDVAIMTEPLDPNYLASTEIRFNSIVVNSVAERVITAPFLSRDGEMIGVIQVGTPLRAVADANDQILVITLISAMICIVVSIGLGMWLSKHLLKPIEGIKEAAGSIANTSDLSTRLKWDGPDDELGELTKVFNHMMERLENLFEVQQQFIGDISHELRTPLTSILGHLEIIDKYGVDADSIDALHRETERMSRMVNDLLLLTRADVGEMQIDLYRIDLDAIALEVYEQGLTLAKDRDLKILIDKLEPVTMTGNSDRLRQLLSNLLTNAIKFTPDGGSVSLSIFSEKNNAIIEVSDTGIGINETDLTRIFDRFFQADSARVHRHEFDGAGLGLSIARWIVDIHQGKIEVNSEVGEGTQFRVILPMNIKENTVPRQMSLL